MQSVETRRHYLDCPATDGFGCRCNEIASVPFSKRVRQIADQYQKEAPTVDRFSALKIARRVVKDQDAEMTAA